MSEQTRFQTSHVYSYIPGLQEESTDTYEVTDLPDCVRINYVSKCGEKITADETVTAKVPFFYARNLIEYVAENACRGDCWLDILRENNVPIISM